MGGRLKLVDPAAYRLPYADNSFDIVLSDEVFEHVMDYRAAFREILRVMKPEGVSAHRFPGPMTLIEGHTRLPFSFLCKFRPYLVACAIAGFRTHDQRRYSFGWRDTVASNVGMMDSVTYPTKRHIRRDAEAVGGRVEFVEREELLERSFGRAGRLVQLAKRVRLGAVVAALLAPLGERYMLFASDKSPMLR